MGIPILVYHEISDKSNPWCVSSDNFKEQMQFLAESKYNTITFDELDKANNKSVILTFDDARKGVYQYALPILKKLSFKGVLYIVSDWASGNNIPEKEKYSEFLTWDEIKKLDIFQLGSHTKSHKPLVELSDNELDNELKVSKKDIEDKTGKIATSLSYPYGRFNDKVEKAASNYYKTIATMENGLGENIRRLSRRAVMNDTTIDSFKRLLRPTIALCMITKDEEKNISGCLNSVKDFVDEIIMVDTGSKDKTIEVAKQFGAKVYSIKWEDDFAKARNEAIKHATADWILILDADEKIDQPSKIINLVNNSPPIVYGYNIITKNFTTDSSVSGFNNEQYKGFKGWFSSKKVRLFRRNKDIFFEGRIHEVVDTRIKAIGGKVGITDIFVLHEGYKKEKSSMYVELGKMKAKEEGTAKAYLELGIQNKELARYDEAITALTKAIELDGRLAVAYFNRGIVYSKLNKHNEAIADFDKALEINNKYSEAYFGKGVVHLNIDDLDKARVDFDNCIRFNPNNSAAYLNLGAIFEKLQEYEKAIIVLVKCVTIDNKNAKAFHNLGVVFTKMGNYSKARVAFQQALKLGYDKQKITAMLKELDEKDKGTVSFNVKGSVE